MKTEEPTVKDRFEKLQALIPLRFLASSNDPWYF
jgi:hypothetical protein